QRRRVVVAMRLVEVDVVGLQPLARAVDRLADVLAGQPGVVVPLGAGGKVDLGEDLERLAPLALERLAEDDLGGGGGVGVGGGAGPGAVVLDLGGVGEAVAVDDLADLEAGAAEVTVFHPTSLEPPRPARLRAGRMVVTCVTAKPSSAPGRDRRPS